MVLPEAYIWLDILIEYCKKDMLPDPEIEALELCKRLIREKYTGYADERVQIRVVGEKEEKWAQGGRERKR